jgi:hypothetical protein
LRWSSAARAVILFVVLAAVSTLGQDAVEATYWSGHVKEIPGKKQGRLDLSGEPLRFVWDKGSWSVPYARIKTVYVSLTRRSAMVEVVGVPGAPRKLLLSLLFTDERGKNRNCVFYLPRGPGADFLKALEEKVGRSVVYESEEARKAAHAQD